MPIEPMSPGEPGTSLPIGATFGHYDIRALLGAGGMGEVYRAFDPRLGREVALKIIGRFAADDESALDRLLREATLASALNHPNIVTIYETGVVGTDRYIAMELVEGSTLARWRPRAAALADHRHRAPGRRGARGRACRADHPPRHQARQRDGAAGRLRQSCSTSAWRGRSPIISRRLDRRGTSATEAGLILGTIGYMAPEQARGEPVRAEADVFSLGVVLYELVTGRHPFMAAVAARHAARAALGDA